MEGSGSVVGDICWAPTCAIDNLPVERALAGCANSIAEQVSLAIDWHESGALTALAKSGLSQRDTPPHGGTLRQSKHAAFLFRRAVRSFPDEQLAGARVDPASIIQFDRPLRIAGDHDHRAKTVAIGEGNGELRDSPPDG